MRCLNQIYSAGHSHLQFALQKLATGFWQSSESNLIFFDDGRNVCSTRIRTLSLIFDCYFEKKPFCRSVCEIT